MIPRAWIVAAGLSAMVAASAGGFFFGRSYEAGEQAKTQLDKALAYAGEIVAQQDRADVTADHIEQLRKAAGKANRVITKEVTRYVEVTKPADRCDLPATWRVRHDAAATGAATDTEALAVAAAGAGAVADAAALETVADNYEACRGYIEQVKGWQAYYRMLTGEIRAQAEKGE